MSQTSHLKSNIGSSFEIGRNFGTPDVHFTTFSRWDGSKKVLGFESLKVKKIKNRNMWMNNQGRGNRQNKWGHNSRRKMNADDFEVFDMDEPF